GGEVEGAENHHYAVRLVAHGGGALQSAVEPPLPGPFGIGSDRDLDFGDDRFDLTACFPQRLAGLAGNQLGEGILFLANFIRKAAHQLDPRGERLSRPLRPGAAGAHYGFVNVADPPAPQFLTGSRLVGNDLGFVHGRSKVSLPGMPKGLTDKPLAAPARPRFMRYHLRGPQGPAACRAPHPSPAAQRSWIRAGPNRPSRQSLPKSIRLRRSASTAAYRPTSTDAYRSRSHSH